MNILEKVLSFDNHWTAEDADFSVSQLTGSSNYQLYLHKQGTPKTFKNDLDLSVASQVGTGFHLRAEEALIDEDVLTEHSMCYPISGQIISGTADVFYDNGLEVIVGDFKTKGTYQMKKFLKGDVEATRQQLSIYAYMFMLGKDVDMPTKGEVYLVHVGDAGYFSKADCAELGIPEKSKVPKSKTVVLNLLNREEVENLVYAKTAVVDSTVDCEKWRCSYCEYECPNRMN